MTTTLTFATTGQKEIKLSETAKEFVEKLNSDLRKFSSQEIHNVIKSSIKIQKESLLESIKIENSRIDDSNYLIKHLSTLMNFKEETLNN